MFRLSQYLLLQTAADDALIRLKHSSLSEDEVEYFRNVYCQEQHHQSIFDFLEYSVSNNDIHRIHASELFMQVFTSIWLYSMVHDCSFDYGVCFDFRTQSGQPVKLVWHPGWRISK